MENNKIVKHTDVSKALVVLDNNDQTDALAIIDNLLIDCSPEQRNKVIKALGKEIVYSNPTASNQDAYSLAIKEGRVNPKEDFSLKHESPMLNASEGIIKGGGGISPNYKARVTRLANFNHWRAFWVAMENVKEGDMPLFDFHMNYVSKYAFDILNPESGYKYLLFVRHQLLTLIDDDPLDDDFTKASKKKKSKVANKKLKGYIESLKDIIEIIHQDKALK